ncbi:hypothetical protein MBH78_16000 [Oceanimonas sp. NS1]|nr:hypothetical protein [Oceanimonas sp. NS1]
MYSKDVLFADPAHDIRGIESLVAYFEGLFAGAAVPVRHYSGDGAGR